MGWSLSCAQTGIKAQKYGPSLRQVASGFHVSGLLPGCSEIAQPVARVVQGLHHRRPVGVAGVPVDSLFTNLESGLSLDEYLDCFPDVTREQAVAVFEYAHR